MPLGLPAGFISNLKPVSITTSSLPDGTQNSAYSQSVAATGGLGTYTWSVISGSLPTGLSLNSSTGAITGTPTGYGTSNFTVQATSAGMSDTKALSIAVTQTAFTQTISVDTANVNLYTLFGNPAGGSGYSYAVTINAGVTVYATSTAVGAIEVGSIPSGALISIVNNGSIIGKGGNGADGPGSPGAYGSAGYSGGNAINTSRPISITNNGTIAGGGGGGGSGACYGVPGVSGGGGGGGQSYSATSGGTTAYSGAAGAGIGGSSASGGRGGHGGQAANTGGGAGGAYGVAGADGADYNLESMDGYTAPGGGGGGYGAAGGAGGNCYASLYGGSGGNGGKAVNANGQTITWLANGTRYGALV